jgi:hypothetical protein
MIRTFKFKWTIKAKSDFLKRSEVSKQFILSMELLNETAWVTVIKNNTKTEASH